MNEKKNITRYEDWERGKTRLDVIDIFSMKRGEKTPGSPPHPHDWGGGGEGERERERKTGEREGDLGEILSRNGRD